MATGGANLPHEVGNREPRERLVITGEKRPIKYGTFVQKHAAACRQVGTERAESRSMQGGIATGKCNGKREER